MPEIKAAIVPVTPFQQNCTILWEEPGKRAVVIDPGGEVPRILDAIRRLGVRVERILLTHGHIDHAGGAAALKEALEQAAAACGQGAARPVRSARPAPRRARSARAAPPVAPPAVPRPFLHRGPRSARPLYPPGLEKQAPTFGMTGVRNVLPDRWLAEGDQVRVGDQTFGVLHCPGHTPGHLVFVSQARASPSSATCCSRARSGAPTFPTATTPR